MIRGIGIDIVDTARMRLALDRNKNIVSKILTDAEIGQLPNSDFSSARFVESLSARFAAKEALAKALGESLFSIGLHNIEVLKPEGSDKPCITVLGPSLGDLGKSHKFHLSLTHSDASAAAVVIAES